MNPYATENDLQPIASMTTGQVIRWWELRRIPYNLILLVIGVSAVFGMEWLMTKVIPPGEDAVEPILLFSGTVAYALLANCCYTLGWIIEVQGKKYDPASARQLGRWMFRNGLIVSCVLTTAPFWIGLMYWLLHRNYGAH